ncbi:hypothetical protein PUV54_12695 [Hyphococcus flavus]|uniref:Uncharacterized protein n=1 Tax=Hyphococcus flavus TaxID=1866326 RepID=A0AAE9ZE13_9PROT|nr:hypothetical protein [Hyphococcus flavus]WDI30812.1 hypothetical protein PUV54_12695 [Hyphococcus flavus]
MRAQKPFQAAQGSRLADYASRMGEALVRRRAELEARAARALRRKPRSRRDPNFWRI